MKQAAHKFVYLRYLLLLCLCTSLPSSHAAALSPLKNEPVNRGLYLSPLRTYLTVSAGDTVTRAFTVANFTENPLTVSVKVEQFSVTDYSYAYQFSTVKDDWIEPLEKRIVLKPSESHQIAYRVNIPRYASPGGHYYTLYAASTTQNGSTTTTVQAATMLYLTVNGMLSRTFTITSALPHIVISPSVRYRLTVRNTGNTHYFGYSTAQVDGLFYHHVPNGTSQLFMPNSTREVNNMIQSPFLPGIYKVSYSFTPDQGTRFSGSRYFLFLPLWSIAFLIIFVAIMTHYITRRLKRTKSHAD